MRRRSGRLTMVLSALVAGSAAAQTIDVGQTTLSTEMMIVSGTAPVGENAKEGPLDYALFSREVFAYAVKEILPEADDEYTGSGIPSRLNDDGMVGERTGLERGRFGNHCRIAVRDVAAMMFGEESAKGVAASTVPALVPGLVRTAATAFILRDAWSLFRERGDDREQPNLFSLEPRISARKIEARIAFRW